MCMRTYRFCPSLTHSFSLSLVRSLSVCGQMIYVYFYVCSQPNNHAMLTDTWTHSRATPIPCVMCLFFISCQIIKVTMSNGFFFLLATMLYICILYTHYTDVLGNVIIFHRYFSCFAIFYPLLAIQKKSAQN